MEIYSVVIRGSVKFSKKLPKIVPSTEIVDNLYFSKDYFEKNDK